MIAKSDQWILTRFPSLSRAFEMWCAVVKVKSGGYALIWTGDPIIMSDVL